MDESERSSVPRDWKPVLYGLASVCVGLTVGVGVYTFIYARGASYLSNNPAACANCHVMNDQHDAWIKSTHHAVATCNDCHTPHNLLGKYAVKGKNGFWHSFYFTTGRFKEPIQISKSNKAIAEANCRRCHEGVVHAMDGPHARQDKLSCVQCHGSVGHP